MISGRSRRRRGRCSLESDHSGGRRVWEPVALTISGTRLVALGLARASGSDPEEPPVIEIAVADHHVDDPAAVGRGTGLGAGGSRRAGDAAETGAVRDDRETGRPSCGARSATAGTRSVRCPGASFPALSRAFDVDGIGIKSGTETTASTDTRFTVRALRRSVLMYRSNDKVRIIRGLLPASRAGCEGGRRLPRSARGPRTRTVTVQPANSSSA
jgi:hypothetical protein